MIMHVKLHLCHTHKAKLLHDVVKIVMGVEFIIYRRTILIRFQSQKRMSWACVVSILCYAVLVGTILDVYNEQIWKLSHDATVTSPEDAHNTAQPLRV